MLKLQVFQGKNRPKLSNYYPVKLQIPLETRVVNVAKNYRREACQGWQISLRMYLFMCCLEMKIEFLFYCLLNG